MYHHIPELPSPPLSPLSPQDQASGGMVHAKSYSIYEDSSDCNSHNQHYLPQQQQHNQGRESKHHVLPDVVMSAEDWYQVQTHIGSLEKDISQASRMNKLLNQELDNVNNQIQRLTSQKYEGSQNQYEFLVHQIDGLHRQLQLAHNQISRGGFGGSDVGYYKALRQGEQPDTTKQLQSEVKELAKSLKNWQIAFQQAEEKYKRKCEGERTLKQTLRKRETQLSSLIEKLNECEKSIANHKELEELEEKKRSSVSSHVPTPTPVKITSVDHKMKADDNKRKPRIIPEQHTEERVTITTSQLTMAILSWAFSYVLP
ncbi:hypothetical protein BGX21_005255 [Mortierella sp. AD011]|nr:hypothetical protein BGX21_005255 [Mortierella sp. AD011]